MKDFLLSFFTVRICSYLVLKNENLGSRIARKKVRGIYQIYKFKKHTINSVHTISQDRHRYLPVPRYVFRTSKTNESVIQSTTVYMYTIFLDQKWAQENTSAEQKIPPKEGNFLLFFQDLTNIKSINGTYIHKCSQSIHKSD